MSTELDADLLFERHPDPMWIYDPSTLMFLAVNAAAISHYGYARDEFLRMTITDIRPTSEAPRLRKLLDRRPGGLRSNGLWRHRRRSGDIIDVDVRSQFIPWEDREAVMICARDVTDLLAVQREQRGRLERIPARFAPRENGAPVAQDAIDSPRADLQASHLQVREYELQLNMVQRLLRLALWRLDTASGDMFWSHNVEDILGCTPQNVTELQACLHPEERDEQRPQLLMALDAGRSHFNFEHRVVRPDGSVRHVRGIAERGVGVSKSVLTGALQDVTEERRQQREAESLAERLQDTLESMSDAFFLLDKQCCFIFVNSQAEILLRRKASELEGSCIWAEFSATPEHIIRSQFETALASGEARHSKSFYAPLDTWLDVSAYPCADGLAVYFRDVTDSEQREQQLRLLEAAVSHQSDMLVICERSPGDPLGWQVAYVNDAVVRITGYEREEMVGQPARRLVGVGTAPAEYKAMQTALDVGLPARLEVTIRRRDGREIVIDIDMVPLLGDPKPEQTVSVSHWVWVSRDITDRVAAEQQVRQDEERGRQARKLEAVGQLTGGIAHDFNNLLTVLLGNAELLYEQLDDRPQLLELVAMMINAAGRGAELTGRLLAFARRQPLQPRVLDLYSVLAGMDGLLRRTLFETIEIELIRGGGLWPAAVDQGQFEVSLLNLAINARDAMPEGGRLTLETANARLDDEYANGNSEIVPGQYVMVSVSDTGEGIPAELLDQIFEPFFTTKAPGKGTGMGLSMVYGFVKQSGGHLRIYSEPGEGTTVRLYFPRAHGAAMPLQTQLTEEVAQAGNGEHILVVEDDALVREHVVTLLQNLGYRVTSAASGAEGLQLLKIHNTIDLLFTDVIMPGGMNGRELADAAHEIRPDLCVLFTSGYAENAIVHHGRLDSGVHLLSKPYRRAELAAKIHKLLGQA